MFEIKTRPLKDIDFAVGTKSLEIDQKRPIRRIVCRYFFKITNTATAPTIKQDDILNLIKKTKMFAGTDQVKVNVSGRMKFFKEKKDKGSEPNLTKAPTGTSAVATAEVTLCYDFANDVNDLNDVSALWKDMEKVRTIEIEWGVAADLASANAPTISATAGDSGVKIEIYEVFGSAIVIDSDGNETVKLAEDLIVEDIREGTATLKIDAVHSQYYNDTLPKGIEPADAIILENVLMVLDDSTRDNTLVTEFQVKQTRPNEKTILHRTWKSIWSEQKAALALETLDVGIVFLNWEETFPEIGLETTSDKEDIKFHFIVIAPTGTDTIEIFTRYVVKV